ncbi:DeoR/GlpR family DNA-binding transcription regulator [Lederbergia ruris]|uniref:DeoR/GlpR family DNA-binding transcription regulator n=1 Tax=Lederbergia ruris TaxID=217495 RepID=UPI0039A3E62E
MIAAERRNRIKELLLENKSVKASDLVKQFNVSEETIRRDLSQLEQEGILEKNYGGAVLAEKFQKDTLILPIRQRQRQFFEEKQQIGKCASKLVQANQTIILDAGSTTWHAIREMEKTNDLTIITNALNIAEECTRNDTISVYLLGGKLRRRSLSVVGPQAEMELQKYNADYAFIGTSGISLKQGITSSDLYEAEMKKAMISAGQKSVVLADHSKFQKLGLTSFCHFKDVDILITSDLADEKMLYEVEKAGVEIIVVSANG